MMYPDSKKGTYPMLDHVTWTLGASNAIVHEELEESNVALHIPIMLLRDVVKANIDYRCFCSIYRLFACVSLCTNE